MNYKYNYYCSRHIKAYKTLAMNTFKYGGTSKNWDNTIKCDHYSNTFGKCTNYGRNELKTKQNK